MSNRVKPFWVCAAVAGALLLGACQSANPAQSPASTTAASTMQSSVASPSASSTSSSPTSTAPSPTTDAELLAEATKALEVAYDLETTLGGVGGLIPGTEIPPEFEKVMMEQALELTKELMYNTWDAKVRHKSGKSVMSAIRPVGESRPGALIALTSCRDARAVTYERDGAPYAGVLIKHVAFFKRDVDGTLKMFTWYSEKVSACA